MVSQAWKKLPPVFVVRLWWEGSYSSVEKFTIYGVCVNFIVVQGLEKLCSKHDQHTGYHFQRVVRIVHFRPLITYVVAAANTHTKSGKALWPRHAQTKVACICCRSRILYVLSLKHAPHINTAMEFVFFSFSHKLLLLLDFSILWIWLQPHSDRMHFSSFGIWEASAVAAEAWPVCTSIIP